MSHMALITRPASASPRVIALGGVMPVRADRRSAMRELRAEEWRRRWSILADQHRRAEPCEREWMQRAMRHAELQAGFYGALADRRLREARALLALARAMRRAVLA